MIKSTDLQNRAVEPESIRGEAQFREDLRRVKGVQRTNLAHFADALDAAPRTGNDEDDPEGTRVVEMSDTLAKQLAAALREAANA